MTLIGSHHTAIEADSDAQLDVLVEQHQAQLLEELRMHSGAQFLRVHDCTGDRSVRFVAPWAPEREASSLRFVFHVARSRAGSRARAEVCAELHGETG